MARYPFPWRQFIRLAVNLPGGHHSLLQDSREMARTIRPSPVLHGVEAIPRRGPCLLVSNHYQRRGLWIAWPAAVITVALSEHRDVQPDVHWLVTGGLRLFQTWNRGPELPLTRRLFRRVARAYDMTALPLGDAEERAAALREWMAYARRGGVIGLFPEGARGRANGLVRPVPGLDALCRVLRTIDASILPVGVFEEGDVLHVSFGKPSPLPTRHGEATIMEAIAAQLPPRLRGPYRGEVPVGEEV